LGRSHSVTVLAVEVEKSKRDLKIYK